MTPAPRVIAPRSTSTTRSSVTTQGLCDELLGEQIRRLRLCAGVAIGLWTFGLVMDAFVRPRTVGSELFVSTLVIEALAIVVSGVLFAYLRFTTHPPCIQAHASYRRTNPLRGRGGRGERRVDPRRSRSR